MINHSHKVSGRVAMRRRRESLLSAIAATTLFVSWYLAAAVDAREARVYAVPAQQALSSFDAAFVAANRIDASDTAACVGQACSTQLAQSESLKAQL